MRNSLARPALLVTAVMAGFLIVSPALAAVSINHEYVVPTSNTQPWGITAGSDGNLWFAESSGNNIGKITPSGAITEFPIPTSNSGTTDIAAGPDGNMWFTEENTNKIGKITPSGTITEYPIAVSPSDPFEIAAGPDGNMWFTANAYQHVANAAIGKITPAGVITLYPTTTANSGPSAITAGPDGNLWFTESTGNKVGKITPTGTITEYPAPGGIPSPSSIAAGSNGNLWFGGNAATIGEVTTSGSMDTFPISSGRTPTLMTPGPDGNVWFTESAGYIASVATGGSVTEYQIPTAGSQPVGITTGPDGNMWFTEQNGNKIGYVSGVVAVPVVKTIPDTVNSTTIQVTTPGGTTQTCGSSVASTSLAKPDPGYSYPMGLLDLCLTSPFINNQIRVTFMTNLTPSQVTLRDFNLATQAYTAVSGAAISSTTLNGQPAIQVTFNLADNGSLDSNPYYGSLNDPVGLAVAATPDTGFIGRSVPGSNLPLAGLVFFGLISGTGFTILRRTRPAS